MAAARAATSASFLMSPASDGRHAHESGQASNGGVTLVQAVEHVNPPPRLPIQDARHMKIFGDLRAGLSPAVEELLEGFDSSSATRLSKRETVVEGVGGIGLLAAVLISHLLIGHERELD